MCDIWQRADSREFEPMELYRHRDSLVKLGVRQVVLTGGEPLLHRDFGEICSFLRSLNIRVTLLTTGLLLHAKAGLIVGAVDEIIVSLDGPPAVHDAIRRIPRAFETAAKGIATVRSLAPQIPISCRTTVQKLNHRHLRATVDAAHSIGLTSISFLAADLSSAAFNREDPWTGSRQLEIALTSSELSGLEYEIELLFAQCADHIASRFITESPAKLLGISNRFREYLEPIPPRSPACNAPWVSAVMEIDGSLRPCFFHPPVSSTTKRTLEEALNSETAQAFRSRLDVASNPICRRCVCSLNYRDAPPTTQMQA